MKTIRGKKALITGAGSGIGRSIVLALAAEGADTFLLDIDATKLQQTAHEARKFGCAVETLICDLSQPDEIKAAAKTVLEKWKTINILINNAGVSYVGPTHKMSDSQWRDIYTVNLLAPVQLVREFLPTLIAQEEAHIVNVASLLGLVTIRKMAGYQASKFAIVGFSAALSAEYGSPGFGVTALCPGFVRTPLFDEHAMSHRRPVPPWIFVTPDQVASKAITAIRKNRQIQVVSPVGSLYWWLYRLSPRFIDWANREGWRHRGRTRI